MEAAEQAAEDVIPWQTQGNGAQKEVHYVLELCPVPGMVRRTVIAPTQCMNGYWKSGPIPKRRGKVKWFDTREGYGILFVRP